MILRKLIPLLLLAILFACNKTDNSKPDGEIIGTSEDLQKGLRAFASDYFSSMLQANDENLLISPLSLQTALYMTANGAKGNTLDEMKTVLGIKDMNINGLNQEYKNLEESFTSSFDDTKLNISNSIWWDDRLVPRETFLSDMKTYYKADTNNKDFSAAETVDAINDWADDKTEGRIKKVLDQITDDEVLFLINALYFTGDWKHSFAEEATRKAAFNLKNGATVNVPMMNAIGSRSAYLGDDYKAVDLTFKGDEYAMTFILPGADRSPATFVTENDMKTLLSDLYDNQLTAQSVSISIPKFEIVNKHMLKDLLIGLGMKDAFSPSAADLSNLGTAGGNLFITRVIQDTYLKIDEKGAEGAAVTTIGVGETSVPPPIIFDRPFIFTIRHVESGAMVFMGSVQNPADS